MKTSNMNFGEALEHLKQSDEWTSYKVTRENWYGSDANPLVFLQRPDVNSKMTEPYLYMSKMITKADGYRTAVCFPLDLSCESILAEDWMIVI